MKTHLHRWATVAGLTLALCACGGGGSGGPSFVPAPPVEPTPETPGPTPPEVAAVNIFESPATQQFAAYNGGPGELQLRYDAATQTYEVNSDGDTWEALRQGAGSNEYNFNSVYWLSTSASNGYSYSALADWSTLAFGTTAFGIPTPAGAVPTTGTASFDGPISGWSDAMAPDSDPWGTTNVHGSINLDFDFAAGTLSGSIHPQLTFILEGPGTRPHDLGSIAFSNTVFSPGATAFSGQFQTTAAGPNAFSGQFTGPGAEELIGKWILPFRWDDPAFGDNQVHSVFGAFVAKR